MPDLHTALEAAIRERLTAAAALLAAIGSSRWHVEYLGERGYPQRISNDRALLLAEVFEGIRPAPVAEHIAVHDPDDAVRRYERDLRVLKRHTPTAAPHLGAVLICAYEWADGDGWDVLWAEHPPIADLLDVYPEVPR